MTGTSAPRYFFIIGAMKAGTTSLFKYLAGHPQLCPSVRKEPKVFRDPGDPKAQRRALRELFEGRTDQPWCFEASTSYTKYPKFPGVPARLREAVPDARFIYLVRNPVERAWSHYIHNLACGSETRTFARAFQERPQDRDFSSYHLQLQQYHSVFPRETTLVLVFEEMAASPAATVRGVCEFLGVDTSYVPSADVVYNASSAKRMASTPLRMFQRVGLDESLPWRIRQRLRDSGSPLPAKTAALTPELRSMVADTVRADIEAFLGVLGRRVNAWREFA
jgi:hypothetical protein